MDLTGYFDPVSLTKPEYFLLPDKDTFSRNITIHTPDQPLKEVEKYDVAIIGLPEEKGGVVKGSALAPDHVRGMLYQLRKINNLKIYDLGNLIITENINNTYYAVRDITLELVENNILPVFIGGSNDLGYGVLLALEKINTLSQIVSIDPRLDLTLDFKEKTSSRNYLNHLFDEAFKNKYTFSNIGHQTYYITEDQIDSLENEFMLGIRLGEARNNISALEPVIRDSDFFIVDMSAVKQSDSPGVSIPSPNGFNGDEICALSRYAGMSDGLQAFNLDQTSHLGAQAIWYFIDGIANRLSENPYTNKSHTKKFIISLNKVEQELVFYKSNVSDRWWVEIPVLNPETNHYHYISCSYDDYKQACNNLIPDRWWRYYHRLS